MIGISCPDGFNHDSHLQDGRTCIGVTDPVKLDNDMCNVDTDKQRDYLRNINIETMTYIRHKLNESTWIGLHQVEGNDWSYLDGTPVEPELFQDLNPSSWFEDTEPSNATTCAMVLPSGQIEASNIGCSLKKPALCSYRTCLTTDGDDCVFPFKYRNKTNDGFETELTYHECSTVDLYKPWCPTGNINSQENSNMSLILFHRT